MVSVSPYTMRPSAEAATEAATICGGKLGGGAGSVLALTFSTVSSTSTAPVTGWKRRNSLLVTTNAQPSRVNAAPSGGSASATVRVPRSGSSMTVSPQKGVFGGRKFPKWVTSRKRPSCESATEAGCGGRGIDVVTDSVAIEITSIRLAVKLAT